MRRLCVRNWTFESLAGGTHAAAGARGRIQAVRFDKPRMLHRRDDELSDAHAARDLEQLRSEIDQNDLSSPR